MLHQKIYPLVLEYGLNESKISFLGPRAVANKIFRTTNYSNDNIALLETGFNKEIEKNTTLLLEQEKETEVYLAIRKLLEKEATNNLLPEVEASNPAYKLFIQFKADNVSTHVRVSNHKISSKRVA